MNLTQRYYRFLILLLVLVLSLSFNRIVGQSLNDTLSLPEIEIQSSYSLKNQGFKRVRIDSSLLLPKMNLDLSSILAQNSTIFIKSYGNGGLATPSFRGTTANHTQVEWNGININSPMLGQTDFSTIPVSQFDGIEILYGAAGLSQSSGAFGGVINLVTNPDWENKLNLFIAPTIASFHTYGGTAHVSAGNARFQSITKGNYLQSLNDFQYYDNSLETQTMKNASFYNYGITEELFYKPTNRDYLTAKVWYSRDFRNLPPIVTSTNNQKGESIYDENIRSLVEYKRVNKEFSLIMRSAYVNQFMNYKNDSAGVDDSHIFNSFINRLRFVFPNLGRFTIKPGMDVNYDWVNSEAYDGMKTRSTSAIFSEFNFDINNKVRTSLILREELIDGKFMPVVGSLGVNYKPVNGFDAAITANLSRNFRYPTLNELYWRDFGNPDLKPETEYTAELGLVYNFTAKNRNFFVESELTGYYSLMNEMIQWVIKGNTTTPENITEVVARGLEAGVNLRWNFYGFNLSSLNNYHYCRSTYEKAASSSGNDNSIGKQLIYTPINTFNSTLGITKWNFYLNYNFIFAGLRYTDRDNSHYMAAYNLSNIIFGKNIVVKKYILSLQMQINNLFDLALRTISNVAMPGRNYALTLRFNFRK